MKRRRIIPWIVIIIVLIIAGYVISLLRHGFSAADQPSSLEKMLARSARLLAIPSQAAKEQNPLKPTAANLRDAGELFVARCAGCHGADGAGQTRIGLNLYPKPPDLRKQQTQDLSDGEIRYIIQNGIRLTGMPAWSGDAGNSPDNIWGLVLYIRNFAHPVQINNQEPVQINKQEVEKALASAHYTGSMACRECHKDLYDRWVKTPMANVVRDPREHPEAIIPDLSTNPIAKFTEEDVSLVYGSLWKQRYFTKKGDDYYPQPAQWDVSNHVWRPYFVKPGTDWWEPFYPPDNFKRPTGPTCDGCHSVDYDIQTKQVVEWNVGCERCHGPGSEHVTKPTRDNILNPARIGSIAGTDTCIQCHSQGQPLKNPIDGRYYDWPVGYRVGLALPDFWKLEEHKLGEESFTHFADGTAHKNRMQGNDFVQSLMYHRGVACYSCHDVHGTSNNAELKKPVNELCLNCHGPMSPNGPHTTTLQAHTHHKDGTPGSQCVDCHMPKIEKTIADINVRAHTFAFIPPAKTDKYNIPNSCNICHTDKSSTWATEALKEWKEISPWRMVAKRIIQKDTEETEHEQVGRGQSEKNDSSNEFSFAPQKSLLPSDSVEVMESTTTDFLRDDRE